ncbi:MAG: hypothetical protein AB1473_04080 [Thermodesulfobacteriota bacterium]
MKIDPGPTIHDLRHCWKTNAMRSGVQDAMNSEYHMVDSQGNGRVVFCFGTRIAANDFLAMSRRIVKR